MRKYIVCVGFNAFESTSRNSKQHLRNHSGNRCEVYTKRSCKLVSLAVRDCNGHIYNGYINK